MLKYNATQHKQSHQYYFTYFSAGFTFFMPTVSSTLSLTFTPHLQPKLKFIDIYPHDPYLFLTITVSFTQPQ